MYMFKPTSFVSLARWNKNKYLISKLELDKKIHSSLRKKVYKYTPIQFHFKMAKLFVSLFDTH